MFEAGRPVAVHLVTGVSIVLMASSAGSKENHGPVVITELTLATAPACTQ